MARPLTIKDVHERTGIPVTTIRFYENELPGFFSVTRTAGGHRRYTDESVRQFLMIRRMAEVDGIRLGTIRTKLAGRDQAEANRHIDLLLSVYETLTREMEGMRLRIESLEIQLAALKKSPRPAPAPRKKGWFS